MISQCLITDELINEEFPSNKQATWFCTGIVGIMPKSAVKALADAMLRYETVDVHKYHEIDSSLNTLREKLAFLISTENPSDLCFTRNATEGIIIGLSSIDLEPDDEILTSDQEHGALMDRLNYIDQKGRAKLRMFKISKEPEETFKSARDLLSEKTKILAFSHVSCQTGIRLPVKEICKAGRESGAYILIDGAQSIGNIPVNVRDYDCDFYVGNGHKWLCGPKGTSFLYINPESKIETSTTFIARGSFSDDPITRRNATRFEYGTRDRMLLYGLLIVLSLYDKWKWEQKDGRIKELSSYLKERLIDIPKCILHTPLEWEKSSGNTSFSIEGYSYEKVSEYLTNNWQMMVRSVPEINAIRISTSYFNTFNEIDRLIEALKAF